MTHKSDDRTNIFSGIAVMLMNRATDTLQITMTDGSVFQADAASLNFPPNSVIVESRYIPSINLLYTTTNRGDIIETELPSPYQNTPPDERPIIYLDQRDWSFLAKVLWEPDQISSLAEADAGKCLITLAREQKIVLPMSFSHLGETSWWKDDDRRYNLALTLSQLSRGWQMRYPIDVWKYELRQVFSTRFLKAELPPLRVFTLEGCIEEKEGRDRIMPTEFPEDVEYVRQAIVGAMAYIDTALSATPSQKTPIGNWVDVFQEITNKIATIKRAAAKANIMKLLLMDELGIQTIAEVATEYACTTSQLEQWVRESFFTDLASMPCFGLWSDIIRIKHLDSSTRWETNDLLDLLFLTCASGYADYVVGERATTSHISQAAKRLGRTINVYSRMTDLMQDLHSAGL